MTPSEKEEFAQVLREGITKVGGRLFIRITVFDYMESKLEKAKQTPCTSCGLTEIITKGFCNCCGAKQ